MLFRSGIYAYNAHPLFLGILALYLGWHLAWHRERAFRARLAPIAGFVLLLGITALPMVLYARGAPDEYLLHFQEASLFQREEWTAIDSVAGKAALIAGRYLRFWERACCRPELDLVDSSGVTPLVPAPSSRSPVRASSWDSSAIVTAHSSTSGSSSSR